MKYKRLIIFAIGVIVAVTVVLCFVMKTGILNPVEHQIKLAYKYIQDGQYDEAVLAFTKAIEIDDKNVQLYEMLGLLYTEQIERFEINSLIDLMKQGYEKTEDSEFIDFYIDFAEKLILSEHYKEAFDLLREGFSVTSSEEIKAKISYMYENELLENELNAMDKEWLDDFSDLIASSSSSGFVNSSNIGLLENYGYIKQNERDLVFMFMSDYAGSYLQNKRNFNWNVNIVDANGDGYEDTVQVPENQMDWVMKNYFNIIPSHNIQNSGGMGSEGVYYSNGYYYSPFAGRGDYPPTAIVEKVYSLGNSTYYFIYKKHWAADEFSDEDFTSEQSYYAVLQRKSIDNVEFWSFVDASENSLKLTDYLE